MRTLRRQEPLGAGLRRLACSRIEEAIRCLTRQPGQALEAVRCVREAEALLALLEPDLPRSVVKRERAIFARLVDGLSEMTLPCRLLDRLEKRYGPRDKKAAGDAELAAAVKSLRKRWAGQSQPDAALRSGAGSFNPAIYRLVADMAELRGHAGNWPTDTIDPDAPPRGLRRTYARARKLASEPTTPKALPELVTTLDALQHQLTVISKAAPPILKAQRKLLSRATDAFAELYLDNATDRAIANELGSRAPAPARDIHALSDSAAADLTQALAETPTAFTNRVGVYWSVWRRGNA